MRGEDKTKAQKCSERFTLRWMKPQKKHAGVRFKRFLLQQESLTITLPLMELSLVSAASKTKALKTAETNFEKQQPR